VRPAEVLPSLRAAEREGRSTWRLRQRRRLQQPVRLRERRRMWQRRQLRLQVKPIIAITEGDPAGIGPEIARKAAADPRVLDVCEPVLYGPPAGARFEPGVLSAAAGQAAYDAIVRATADAQRGDVAAVATAPINKEALRLAGFPWNGHTDLLAHLTGATHVAMMFFSDELRVVLATVHVPLADVPKLLTQQLIEKTIALTARELPRFGFAKPKIGVAGLNPHAGEHGLFGREEEIALAPAIAGCRATGIDVSGPFPADTLFVRARKGEFDAVVACYHDQGLIPVKLVAFGRAVNVTLGLPIIRTSVDHGTAFDIAGKGVADADSMIAAVLLAARLARSA
jgi:4-hydroxythreonine-4-phosphate dehydrogenase